MGENKFMKWLKDNIGNIIRGVVLFLFFLPAIGFWWSIFPKVNPDHINLSRLEVVKIIISLIGPILTFIVFQNTLKIQDRQIKKDEKNEVDNMFNSLLDLFLKKQQGHNEIEYINDAIFQDFNRFLNGYDHTKDDFSNEENGNLNLSNNNGFANSFKQPNIIEADINLIKYKNRTHVLNKQYKCIYNFSGPYFKVIHRIIKILNDSLEESKITEKEYKMYIGILRTQLSAEEFTFILFNSIYITRGIGLGIQLVGSGLFGDQTDFEINQHFPTPDVEKAYLKLFEITNDNIETRKKLVEEFEKLKKDSDKFKKTYSFADFYKSLN